MSYLCSEVDAAIKSKYCGAAVTATICRLIDLNLVVVFGQRPMKGTVS